MPDANEERNYSCRRIQSQVYVGKSEDKGKIYVQCKFYTHSDFNGNKSSCIKDFPNFKKCLVKLAVMKEERGN